MNASESMTSSEPAGSSRGVTTRKVVAIIALFLLAAVLGLWGWALFEGEVVICEVVRQALFLLVVGIAIYGLAARAFWGRWLALGIAIGALIQTLVFALFIGPWALMLIPLVLVFGVLIGLLLGRSMARHYDERPSPHNHWDLSRRPVRLLAWAVVLNISAVPMLLTYLASDGWWLTAERRVATIVVATLLTAAIVLVILQRSAGLLLLGLYGLATVLLAADALAGMLGPAPASLDRGGCTMTPREVIVASTVPALVAAVPGAITAVAALTAFARRIWRFLRDTGD